MISAVDATGRYHANQRLAGLFDALASELRRSSDKHYVQCQLHLINGGADITKLVETSTILLHPLQVI